MKDELDFQIAKAKAMVELNKIKCELETSKDITPMREEILNAKVDLIMAEFYGNI